MLGIFRRKEQGRIRFYALNDRHQIGLAVKSFFPSTSLVRD